MDVLLDNTTKPKQVTFQSTLNSAVEMSEKRVEEEKKEEEKVVVIDPLAEQKQLAREIEDIIKNGYKNEDTVGKPIIKRIWVCVVCMLH